MAKIKESALIAGIRGSVGGNTFASGRGGAYVRQKVSPTQPHTQRQSEQRVIFTTVSQAWRNLTDAERAAWETWAANHPVTDIFGNSQTLSGNAAFMKVNADLLTLGLDISNAPLADPTVIPVAVVSVDIVAATGVVTATFADAADGTEVYGVWITRGMSTGVAFANSAFRYGGRLVSTTPFAVGTVTPVSLNPLLTATAGQKVGVIIVRYSDDGAFIDQTLFSAIAA